MSNESKIISRRKIHHVFSINRCMRSSSTVCTNPKQFKGNETKYREVVFHHTHTHTPFKNWWLMHHVFSNWRYKRLRNPFITQLIYFLSIKSKTQYTSTKHNPYLIMRWRKREPAQLTVSWEVCNSFERGGWQLQNPTKLQQRCALKGNKDWSFNNNNNLHRPQNYIYYNQLHWIRTPNKTTLAEGASRAIVTQFKPALNISTRFVSIFCSVDRAKCSERVRTIQIEIRK